MIDHSSSLIPSLKHNSPTTSPWSNSPTFRRTRRPSTKSTSGRKLFRLRYLSIESGRGVEAVLAAAILHLAATYLSAAHPMVYGLKRRFPSGMTNQSAAQLHRRSRVTKGYLILPNRYTNPALNPRFGWKPPVELPPVASGPVAVVPVKVVPARVGVMRKERFG